MDKFIEVKRESWLTRYKNALLGLIIAPVFIGLAFILLRFGEIQHAVTTTSLKNIEVHLNKGTFVNDGSIFYKYDSIFAPGKKLEDPLFSIKISANKLFRAVETWQWAEIQHEKQVKKWDGSVTKTKEYTYKQGWFNEIINSDNFKYKEGHTNPKERKYPNLSIEHHHNLQFGDMILGEDLYEYLLNFEPLDVKKISLSLKSKMVIDTGTSTYLGKALLYPDDTPETIASSGGAGVNTGISVIPFSKAAYSNKPVKTSFIFDSKGTPQAPQIGDTRIMYWYIPEKHYSIIGMKQGQIIKAAPQDSAFIHSEMPDRLSIDSPLGKFGIIYSGEHSPEEMFKLVHKENDLMFAIVVRFMGLLFMVGGFALLGNPLRILFSWLPFLGTIWEKLIFKIMQLLGILASLSVSCYYFIKHNSISNLTVYDFYFIVVVILFFIFFNNLRVSAGSYSEEF